jgi:predicted transcriptional regulator
MNDESDDDIELSTAVPEGSVLRVSVGEPLATGLERVKVVMLALQAGQDVQPHFGVNFPQMSQMLAVFTPKRWELVAALRQAGPSSVRALAARLGRNYKNVHTDVAALEQWLAVQRLPDGRVHVPWREIVVDMQLPDLAQAA